MQTLHSSAVVAAIPQAKIISMLLFVTTHNLIKEPLDAYFFHIIIMFYVAYCLWQCAKHGELRCAVGFYELW